MQMTLNKYRLHLSLLGLILLSTACGVFGSESTNSTGPEEIDVDATVTTFEAGDVSEIFKNLPVKNTTKGRITLYRVLFTNNHCNSFSYYGLNDINGNTVLGPADNINYSFNTQNRIHVIIRFKSEPCSVTNYSTTVTMYFRDADNHLFSSSAILNVRGEAPKDSDGDVVSCDEPIDPETLLPDRRFGIPQNGEKYLRVDAMRAFIYATTAPADYLTVIGTDIGGIDPEAFEKPYLKIEVKNRTATKADFVLKQITSCNEFSIPSPTTDIFFLGSPTLLTNKQDYQGSIDLIDPRASNMGNNQNAFREVHVTLNDFRVTLRAEDIGGATPQNDNSLIDDEATKIFQIGMQADLTTNKSTPDTALVTQYPLAKNNNDENGDPSLSLSPVVNGRRAQQGNPLSDSQMLLVGKGKFDDADENFIGDPGTAKDFLIDHDAYLYIQIQATLMCNTDEEGCL